MHVCRRVGWRALLLGLLAPLLLVAAAPPNSPPAAGLFALVLGETAYTDLPPLPGCTVSQQAIAERLGALGFNVITRTDASNGALSAALIDLASRTARVAAPTVVIYFCGYTAEFDGRVFLLPVEAALERPSDVLTQGLPVQSLLDAANNKTRVGLSLFDTYDRPHAQRGTLGSLAAFVTRRAAAAGHMTIGATETSAGSTATPLAQSLATGLTTPPVDLDRLVGNLRNTLSGSRVTLTTTGTGGGATLIPPTPAPAAPAVPAPAAPAPAPVAAPEQAPAPPPTQGVSMPEEDQYSALDRRRVQAALRELGYYDSDVDGTFGPETRAAIRRYQHEIGAPMTGRLSSAEATRLVAGLAQRGQ